MSFSVPNPSPGTALQAGVMVVVVAGRPGAREARAGRGRS